MTIGRPETIRRVVAEKRKHYRVVVDLPVTCESAGAEPFAGVAKDISVGGMFVECENVLEFDRELRITLLGVAEREVSVPAVVRWRTPRGFGVQFGLLGAYATYVITEIAKSERRDPR
jgi:c-di-GMP-binding flagellar brake protein YcgR